MAYPNICKHLVFYPKDAEDILQNANQGHRWLLELDPNLLMLMIQQNNQDFYFFELAILNDGSVAMPV